MKHQLYRTEDADAPNCVKDSNGEVVLGLCRVCNQAEVELEPECPGNQSALIETLKASVLLEALHEIEKIANEAVDSGECLNRTAKRIAIIACDAAARVTHPRGEGAP